MFGSGEWTIIATIDGSPIGNLENRDVDTGDVIHLDGDIWAREPSLNLNDGKCLSIAVMGEDEDILWNDDLGRIEKTFDARSSPA